MSPAFANDAHLPRFFGKVQFVKLFIKTWCFSSQEEGQFSRAVGNVDLKVLEEGNVGTGICF